MVPSVLQLRVGENFAAPRHMNWRSALSLGLLLALILSLLWPRPPVRVDTTLTLLVVPEGIEARADPSDAEMIVRRLAERCNLSNLQVQAQLSEPHLELVVRTSGNSAVEQWGKLVKLRRLATEAASAGQFHRRAEVTLSPSALSIWQELYHLASDFASDLPAKATESLVEQLTAVETSSTSPSPDAAAVVGKTTASDSNTVVPQPENPLEKKIADLQVTLSQLLVTHTESHPEVIRLREELQRLTDAAQVFASHRIVQDESHRTSDSPVRSGEAMVGGQPIDRPTTSMHAPPISLDQYYQYWKQQSTQFRAAMDRLMTRWETECQDTRVQVAVPARISDLPIDLLRSGGLQRIDWLVILGASLALSYLTYFLLVLASKDRIVTPNELPIRTPGSIVVLVGGVPLRSVCVRGLKLVFALAPRLLVVAVLLILLLVVCDMKFLTNAVYDPWWALSETMRKWSGIG
jgi:hypothetical protein